MSIASGASATIARLSSVGIAAATGGKRASFFRQRSSFSKHGASVNDVKSSSTVNTLMISFKPGRKSMMRYSSGLSNSGETINQSCSADLRRNHSNDDDRNASTAAGLLDTTGPVTAIRARLVFKR